MTVARGFLSFDFHNMFPCNHTRELINICRSMREIALNTVRQFLTKFSDDYKPLEVLITRFTKDLASGSYQELVDAAADGICGVPGKCFLLFSIPWDF